MVYRGAKYPWFVSWNRRFWLFRVKRGEWISTWKKADWTLDTAGALGCLLHAFLPMLPVPKLPMRQRPHVMSLCNQGNCTICPQSSSHGSHLLKATSHLAVLPLKGGRLKRLFILGWSRTGLRHSWTWQLILKNEDTRYYLPTLQGSDEWYVPAQEQLSLCHFSFITDNIHSIFKITAVHDLPNVSSQCCD